MGAKKLSPEFLARVGKTAPTVTRAKNGRLTTSRSEFGKEIATALVNDPQYRKGVLERLRAGVAGPLEVHLWRLAFGDPQKDDSERAAEIAKFDKIRDELRDYMSKNRDQARVLDAVVTRAPRLLPLPTMRRPEPEPEKPDEGDAQPA